MNLLKNLFLVVWATVWLLLSAVCNGFFSFTYEVRTIMGQGKPVGIAVFLISMIAGVIAIGFTGTVIAVLKVN